MFRRMILAAAALLAPLSLAPAMAANLAVKDGTGAAQNLCAITMSDQSLTECNILVDTSGTKIDPATKQLQQSLITALGSPFQANGSIGNASFGAKLLDSTGAAFGTVGNPINVTGISGGGSVPTGTAGSPNAAVMTIQGIAGGTAVPMSALALPLPTGAATAAAQGTANAALGTPADAAATTTDTTATSIIAQLKQQVVKLNGLITALGAPYQANGALPLPSGASTSALQTTGNTSLGTLAGTVAVAGTPAANAQTVQPPSTGFTVTTTLPQISATNIGGIFGTTATQLSAALATRHFVQLQVQGTPDTTGAHGCYINGSGTATTDYNSLFIPRGSYYESATHVGTAAISIICTDAATSVYGRQG